MTAHKLDQECGIMYIKDLSKAERSIVAKMREKKIKDFSYAEMYRVFAPPVATLICFRIVDNTIKAGRLSFSDVRTQGQDSD